VNFFSMFFSTSLMIFIFFIIGYVFYPSNQCDRLSHASNIVYASIGFPVFLGEKLFRKDMTNLWEGVEKATISAHAEMNKYFELEECSAPAMTLYGRRAGAAGGDEWLKTHDPELYDLMHQSYSTPDSDGKGGAL